MAEMLDSTTFQSSLALIRSDVGGSVLRRCLGEKNQLWKLVDAHRRSATPTQPQSPRQRDAPSHAKHSRVVRAGPFIRRRGDVVRGQKEKENQ